MKQSVKRILSLALTLSLVLSLFCVGAAAASFSYTHDGSGKRVELIRLEVDSAWVLSEQVQVGHTIKSSIPVTVDRFFDQDGPTGRPITYRENVATGVQEFTIPDTGLYCLYDEASGDMSCFRGIEGAPAPQTEVSELYDFWQLELSQPVSDVRSERLQYQKTDYATGAVTYEEVSAPVFVVPAGTKILTPGAQLYKAFDAQGKEMGNDDLTKVPGVSIDANFQLVYEGGALTIQSGHWYQVAMEALPGSVYFRAGDPATKPADKPAVPADTTTCSGEKVDAWAKELVDAAIGEMLMPSHLQGTDLRQSITRTQFAALAVELYISMGGASVPLPTENPFTDTQDPQVLQAYALGLTSGVGEGIFGADQTLTREQAATMLTNVYRKVGGQVSVTQGDTFADDGSLSGWARESVYFMYQNKIVSGVGEGKFSPSTPIQSQAALIMAGKMLSSLK